jgi:cyclic pyranopterin monophosphate synthase
MLALQAPRRLTAVTMNANQDQTPPDSADGLTHVDARGQANMVDVGAKPATARRAIAQATIRLDQETCGLLFAGDLPKGEALAVARVAGIQAAKETSRLIPLCHSLALSHAAVAFAPAGNDGVVITAEAATVSGTGVEMEAMAAASVAALTVYDMVKARCRGAVIERVELLHKSGGKSGTYDRPKTSRNESDGAGSGADSVGSE